MNEDRTQRLETGDDEPRELHTEADDAVPLTQREADVAGMIKTDIVYGDSSINPNADDQNDLQHAAPDEHF